MEKGFKAHVSSAKKMVYSRFMEIIKTAFIIYTIRRLNPIPIRQAKLYYVLFLSPLLLTKALTTNNEISPKYRRFLFNFSYPENTFNGETVMQNCRDLHPKSDNSSCIKSFKDNCLVTIRRVAKMYARLYCLHGVIVLLVTRKLYEFLDLNTTSRSRIKDVFKNECVNTVRSTAFLAGQTLFQRLLLCAGSYSKEKLGSRNIYLLSILGSIPVYFERPFRVQQVNNLVMSHIIVGQMKKFDLLKSQLPLCMFLSTVLSDSISLRSVVFFISLVTSATF